VTFLFDMPILRPFLVQSDTTLLCFCGKTFARNKSGKCPRCKAVAEPALYRIDLNMYGGRGSCTCKLFRCNVAPSWDRSDFSVKPCKHLVGVKEESALAGHGRLILAGISDLKALQTRHDGLLRANQQLAEECERLRGKVDQFEKRHGQI